MDPLTTSAAAGMRARLEALDLLANNLANASTAGFKADREAYNTYIGDESAAAAADWTGLVQTTSPVVEIHRTDFSQGQLTITGNDRDLALAGKGFFQVDGPGDGALITRNGKIRVTGDGKLTTAEGYEFTTVEPTRIRVDPALPFTVDPDGTVRQQGNALGRLKLVNAPDTVQPAKRDGVYFVLDKTAAAGLTASGAEVNQGKVEMANYSPAEAAVKLVSVLRQFESLQKAIQINSDMGRKASEEVAKVNS